jgi:hypothetical protein
VKKLILWLTVLIVIPACQRDHEMTEKEAHSVADTALRDYCGRSAANDCLNLAATGATKSELGWLVEYKGGTYLYAVLVKNDKTTEISRFNESQN